MPKLIVSECHIEYAKVNIKDYQNIITNAACQGIKIFSLMHKEFQISEFPPKRYQMYIYTKINLGE